MPRTTSARWPARARMRSTRTNSPGIDARPSTAVARRLRLGGAPLRGGVVEHAVDVRVAVLGAEALRRLDRLVDHDAVRHVGAMQQLIGGDAQHRALDRVDERDLAVEERGELAVERSQVRID